MEVFKRNEPMHMQLPACWRMGTVVPASLADFLEWLTDYIKKSAAVPFPAVRGAAYFGQLAVEPPDPTSPLRVMMNGVVRDEAGYVYPLLRPVEIALTPIGAGEHVVVVLNTDSAEAQAYLVRLVSAVLDRWPVAAEPLWMNQPDSQERSLGQIRLNTDPTHFALGLAEFARRYHPAALVCVHFTESPSATYENHHAWDVHLYLPGPVLPCRCISELVLRLALSRPSGRDPLTATLSQRGKYVGPEVEAFVRDFLTWCRANWPAALPALPAPTTGVRPSAGLPEHPWLSLPNHLWDRRAVELWWAGNSDKEIAQLIHQAPKTIRNRLTQLRKQFGAQIVPFRHPRDKGGTAGY